MLREVRAQICYLGFSSPFKVCSAPRWHLGTGLCCPSGVSRAGSEVPIVRPSHCGHPPGVSLPGGATWALRAAGVLTVATPPAPAWTRIYASGRPGALSPHLVLGPTPCSGPGMLWGGWWRHCPSPYLGTSGREARPLRPPPTHLPLAFLTQGSFYTASPTESDDGDLLLLSLPRPVSLPLLESCSPHPSLGGLPVGQVRPPHPKDLAFVLIPGSVQRGFTERVKGVEVGGNLQIKGTMSKNIPATLVRGWENFYS